MKTRIISAAVAIVLLAAVLFLHTTIILNIALAVIGALMVYEVINAAGCKKQLLVMLPSIALVVFVPIAARFYNGYILYLSAAFLYIVICMAASFKYHSLVNIETVYLIITETLLTGTSMLSLALIEKYCGTIAIHYLILTLCGAWFADTGAYFVGTLFGKHKLCPEISPKKTVEGLMGGFIANAVLFIVYGMIFLKPHGAPNYLLLALMGVMCAVLGVIGDLSASLIKRKYGIKDFGNLMPGHGGAMDRFDSVVYVAPFMAICLTQLTVVV
ncbi:MAG: phosphatidate cytidylyltransferase [Oscillospiraceae bacterium]|nr:phosphatidate cytidylyltransferase [Oscillospiraceae bacterium]